MTHHESSAQTHRRALAIVLVLTLAYAGFEVIGGVWTNSLSLLADAAHMLTDVGGLALALFATWIAQRPATPQKTYGYYRVEVLAAAINAVVLLGAGVYVLYEAFQRLQDPPEVISTPVLVVAVIGLVVNLIGMRILHGGAQTSLNVEGAFLEVLSDMLGSVAVIIAALVMWLTGWYYADPLASIVISVMIVPRTWRLLSNAVHVLMEGTPASVDISHVEAALLTLDEVEQVHDLHVWTLTSGMNTLSAHVLVRGVDGLADGQRVLERINALLRERFDLHHTTIQLEYRDLQLREVDF